MADVSLPPSARDQTSLTFWGSSCHTKVWCMGKSPTLQNLQKKIHLLYFPDLNSFGLANESVTHPPPHQNPLLVAIGFSSGISTHAPAEHNCQILVSLMQYL